MREQDLRKALSDLPLADLRYLEQTSSTNDIALAWATEGAGDFSLVLADEQTAGRGRMGRKWLTPPGAGLAFSVILRPRAGETTAASLMTGLGALALVEAFKNHGLAAAIKWPNDVLVNRKKMAGVLVEAVWLGNRIESTVLGIGVNVLSSSVPPAGRLNFPATSVESEGVQIDRLVLLHEILGAILRWRARMSSTDFVSAWEEMLAFKDELVQVVVDSGADAARLPPREGRIIGLAVDGSLQLESPKGGIFSVSFGEVHLRPV
jgi:BirA family biotin operon repressor/biotin-[acetyl-CoA-carboxylase] ligase